MGFYRLFTPCPAREAGTLPLPSVLFLHPKWSSFRSRRAEAWEEEVRGQRNGFGAREAEFAVPSISGPRQHLGSSWKNSRKTEIASSSPSSAEYPLGGPRNTRKLPFKLLVGGPKLYSKAHSCLEFSRACFGPQHRVVSQAYWVQP